jgi:hypothetical protein
MLELNDNVTTHKAFSELVTRKGLNGYCKWIVLCRIRDERAKAIVQTDILAKAVRDVVHSDCAGMVSYSTLEYKM